MEGTKFEIRQVDFVQVSAVLHICLFSINRTEANPRGGLFITMHTQTSSQAKDEASVPTSGSGFKWWHHFCPSQTKGKLIIGEKERGEEERECKEIKKSKGMSEVSERAMNHSDIPGWVSEAAAVWGWINRGPLKQCSLNTGQVKAQCWPSGKLKRVPILLMVKNLPAAVLP